MLLVLCIHPHGPLLISAAAAGNSSVQADSIPPQGPYGSPCFSAPELPLLTSSANEQSSLEVQGHLQALISIW